MKKYVQFSVLILMTLGTTDVFGWGMTGHRVIAEIAENHLSKKAKKNISKIIGKQKLAYWANWADFIKSDPDPALNKTGSWHFVNTPGNLNFTDFQMALERSSDNNLYKSVLRVQQNLRDPKADLIAKQQNLYYLIHILGDAHQPMHVSREEDQGGNKIEVSFFGRKTNLHRVWDSELVDNEKYSYTEFAEVLDILSQAEIKKITAGALSDWLYESHNYANMIYAAAALDSNLSYSYIYNNKAIVEACLLKGGLRLARVLNEIFG